jgi:hypothetical protein
MRLPITECQFLFDLSFEISFLTLPAFALPCGQWEGCLAKLAERCVWFCCLWSAPFVLKPTRSCTLRGSR